MPWISIVGEFKRNAIQFLYLTLQPSRRSSDTNLCSTISVVQVCQRQVGSCRRDAIGSRHASGYGRWTTPSGRVVAGMAVGTLPASAAYNHVLNGILCTLRINVLHGLACSSQTSTTAVLIHTILSPMLACLPPADCIIQPSQDKLYIKQFFFLYPLPSTSYLLLLPPTS